MDKKKEEEREKKIKWIEMRGSRRIEETEKEKKIWMSRM